MSRRLTPLHQIERDLDRTRIEMREIQAEMRRTDMFRSAELMGKFFLARQRSVDLVEQLWELHQAQP